MRAVHKLSKSSCTGIRYCILETVSLCSEIIDCLGDLTHISLRFHSLDVSDTALYIIRETDKTPELLGVVTDA